MEGRPAFRKSVAVVVGVDAYRDGVPPLRTAANDARRLGRLLADAHGYEVHLRLDERATLAGLTGLLTEELPRAVGPDDRVLFYFAGHGVALGGDDGPTGYLLPQDARRGAAESYLHMPALYDALTALDCRHMLVVLDSCFSGAFRWSSTRDLVVQPGVVHRERYERFVLDPAWQAIASASHDQTALDEIPGTFGERGDEGGHSPFAQALFEALDGAGDVVPEGGDGVITATELYLYLEQRLQPSTIEAGHRQTPRLWPLAKHDKGEFVFLVPGRELDLPPAPELTVENNPWRGLESYDEAHEDLFFGRGAVIDELEAHVRERPLTVVLGASGTGKSSVVKAGLVPRLRRDVAREWRVLPVVRPGAAPRRALERAVADLGAAGTVEERVAAWCAAHPDARLVLVVDQVEELVTLARAASERGAVLDLLHRLVEAHAGQLRLVLTLRSDFEPQFDRSALEARWTRARYVVPPMTQAEVREVIERPASQRVLYFAPHGLVDALIDEVVQTPGGLPLLSFALSEMYVHYLGRRSDDRALEAADYEAVGGVVGALRTRADAEFEALDGAHRETMRRLMLRMVAVEGGSVARRRVPRSELEYPEAAETERAAEVVRRLTAARLVVEGRGEDGEAYVEPAHDALVRAWGRLLGWVHAEQGRVADLRFQHAMARAAREWERAETQRAKAGLLWRDAARGGLLGPLVACEEAALPREALTWGQRLESGARALVARLRDSGPDAAGPWMNARELAFAQRSIRRRRQARLLLGTLVLLIVGAGGAAVVYAGIAERSAAEARTQRDLAVARGYVSRSGEALGRDPVEALVFAIAAADSLPDRYRESALALDVEAALHAALRAPRVRLELGLGSDVRNPFVDADTLDRFFLFRGAGGVAVWDAEAARWLDTLARPGRPLGDAAISDDGRWLATVDSGDTVRLWDFEGSPVAERRLPGAMLVRVAVSADGARVAVKDGDGRGYVWEVGADGLALLEDPSGQPAEIGEALVFLPGHELVTSGTAVWDVATGEEVVAASEEAESDVVSPDGRHALEVRFGPESEAVVWDIAGGRRVVVPPSDDVALDELSDGALSRGASVVVMTDTRGRSVAWRRTGAGYRRASGYSFVEDVGFSVDPRGLNTHDFHPYRTALSPDGSFAVTTSRSGRVRVWAVADGREIATLRGHLGAVTSATFLPSGSGVVTGDDLGTVRVWDTPPLAFVGTAGAGRAPVALDPTSRDTLWSPTGAYAVTAELPSMRLDLEPAAGGGGRRFLFGHWSNVELFGHAYFGGDFSSDEERLVTYATEGTARLWDVATGRQIAVFGGADHRVVRAAFGSDPAHLYTEDDRGVRRVYPVEFDALVALARERLPETLTEGQRRAILTP